MSRIHLSFAFAIAVTMFLSSSQANADLIGHWKMDETSGDVAADSANGNDGMYEFYNNDPLWQTGIIGGAVGLNDEDPFLTDPRDPNVNGYAEYFTVAEIAQMDGASQLTMSIWFNENDVPNLNDGNSGLFRSRDLENTTNTGRAAGLNLEGDPLSSVWHIDARMASGNGQNDSAEFPEGPGWHHVAMVWDSTDDSGGADTGLTKVYVDGVLSSTVSHAQLAKPVVDSGTWFIGGYLCCNGTTRGFTGALDDLALWDEALSDGEISRIYSGGLQGVEAPTARIPEPASLCLAGILAGGLLVSRRRQ